jgi:putative tryptophan/tyrosine transport system substrate-binding protein
LRRRAFIAVLGIAAALPVVVRAQRSAMPVIGYLGAATLESSRDRVAAFHRGLAETGYIEGSNVAIEYRWADDHYDRLPALAAELVRRRPAAIVMGGSTPGALALKAATQTIPIVFQIGSDAVEIGLVASLSRPGGNVTGVSAITTELVAKRLEMLRELVPTAASVALLVNPTNSTLTAAETKEAQAAARVLGLQLLVLNATTPSEIEVAFATLVRQRTDALLVSAEIFFLTSGDHLVTLAARRAVPAIYGFRETTTAGGLVSYGASISDTFRQVGAYTGRILNGEKPSDLPVLQPTKFELAINLKTAKALGLTIPETLLATADEVIQ